MTTEYKVPWSGRGHKYTPEELELVTRVMQEADPLTQGRHQAEFEAKLAKYLGTPHVFAVATATAALELSAMLAQLKPGDEVIIPAHTFAATAISFGRTGAKLVWADIDPELWVATAETIEPLITPRTKVIVVVHLYGLPTPMGPILELAKRHDLKIVEDSAQALGATWRGRPAGTFGDFACFSFHSHKNLTTLGEGGALVVKDPELARLVPRLRHNGTCQFPGERTDYWIPAMSNIDSALDGVWPYNFCLGEVQCALGTKLLDRVEGVNAIRRKRTLQIQRELRDFPEAVWQKIPQDSISSHHLLPMRYDGAGRKGTRDALIRLLSSEYGIKAVVQYCPLYRYPLFQKFGFGGHACPNTEHFFDNMLSLPFQEWLNEDQVGHLVSSLKLALARLR